MTFNLNVLEECLHVQYEVIFCRNNIMAVFCIFANSSRILCTLMTVGKGKGLQMIYVQCKISVMYVREFNFYGLMFLDSFALQNVAVLAKLLSSTRQATPLRLL